MDTGLLGHPINPPRHGQVEKHKIQAFVRNKKESDAHIQGFQ
jgi:hypothetical protein